MIAIATKLLTPWRASMISLPPPCVDESVFDVTIYGRTIEFDIVRELKIVFNISTFATNED